MQEPIKNFYDKEQKTRQGEVIIRRGDGSFKIKDVHGEEYFWVEDEPKYFFKQNNDVTDRDGEILYSYLASALGLDVVKVRPAVDVNAVKAPHQAKEGLIAQDYAHGLDNTIMVHAYKLKDLEVYHSVEENLAAVQDYKETLMEIHRTRKVFVDKNLATSLEKMLVLDFLTLQEDRHSGNVVYTATKTEEVIFIRLGKIFDNSMVFYFCAPQTFNRLSNSFKLGQFEWFNISVDDFYRPKFFFKKGDDKKMPEDVAGNETTLYQTRQIARLAARNSVIDEFFKKADNLSFDSILETIKQDMPEYNIGKGKATLAKYMWQHRVNILRTAIFEAKLTKNQKQQQTEQKPKTKVCKEKERDM